MTIKHLIIVPPFAFLTLALALTLTLTLICSCSLVVHPSLDRDKVQAAIATLKYGTIAINCWSGMCFQFETEHFQETQG